MAAAEQSVPLYLCPIERSRGKRHRFVTGHHAVSAWCEAPDGKATLFVRDGLTRFKLSMTLDRSGPLGSTDVQLPDTLIKQIAPLRMSDSDVDVGDRRVAIVGHDTVLWGKRRRGRLGQAGSGFDSGLSPVRMSRF